MDGTDHGSYQVDARGAGGVLVGDHGVQVNYYVYRGTWTDGVAPQPLIGEGGEISSPYRGLSAFEERDTALFFGREIATDHVLARMSRCLDRSGLLVVSGVSGAGKSSLLRAGVLPQLRRTGLSDAPEAVSWQCVVLTPAQAPLAELAVRMAPLTGIDSARVRQQLATDPAGFALTAHQAALSPAGSPVQYPRPPEGSGQRRIVLIVDQFEQAFTQCASEQERQAFITALHSAATTGYGSGQLPAAIVILAVRSDFEARLASYPQLEGAVQDRYLLTPMTRRQLRMAITKPAAAAGSRVDDELVNQLLEEIGACAGARTAPGVLPLVSHALDQAWRGRAGAELTLRDYERTGGIERAVTESAERVYAGLTRAQQTVARQVFTRLIAVGSDGKDTATRASRCDLADNGGEPARAADIQRVLDAFTDERLLTMAADAVEISHEILLTAWRRVGEWLAGTHADRHILSRLSAIAGEWERARNDPSYLYSGTRLVAARETAIRISSDPRYQPLSETERAFLHASDEAVRRGGRRRQRIIATLIGLVAALAIVATAAGAAMVAAFKASQRSARDRVSALSGELAAQSIADNGMNATLSAMQSLAAYALDPSSSQARNAMLTAAANPEIATFAAGRGPVSSLTYGPHGSTLVTGGNNGQVQEWDPATRGRHGPLLAHGTASVAWLAYSPQYQTLAAADFDGIVSLWNLARRPKLIKRFHIGGTTGISVVAFSANGQMIAIANRGAIQFWNLTTGQPAGRGLPTGMGSISSLALSKNTLAAGGSDGSIRLWKLASRKPLPTIPTGLGIVFPLKFSPDGSELAAGSLSGAIQMWNVTGGSRLDRTLSGGNNPIVITFSPDGSKLAVASLDGSSYIWDLSARQAAGHPLPGSTGSAYAAAFSPDGKTLATGDNAAARLWDVTAALQPEHIPAALTEIRAVAFSGTDHAIATVDNAGQLRLQDLDVRQLADPVTVGTGTLAFSRNGQELAVADRDGRVRIWNLAGHRPYIARMVLCGTGPSCAMAFSWNGRQLATAASGGRIQMWDSLTGKQLRSLTIAHLQVNSLAFSPDGKILAAADWDGTTRIWNVATGKKIGGPLGGGLQISGSPAKYNDQVSVTFSPDGSTLVAANSLGTRMWDVRDVPTFQQITGKSSEIL